MNTPSLRSVLKPLAYTALGGALVTQCPKGSEREITDLTTTVNNVCGKALTEGEVSYTQDLDGGILFQAVAETDKRIGADYADLCICTVPADFSAITCTGAKNFNSANTFSMNNTFNVDVDQSGYLSMNRYSPLSDILMVEAGASVQDLQDKVMEQAESSMVEVDDQDSDAANSARRMMNLYRDYLHRVFDADQMPVIMVNPSTGEIMIPGEDQGGCDTNGGLDPFGEPILPQQYPSSI